MIPADRDLPTESSAAAVRARNLRTLALLAARFLLPVVLAFLAYYGTSWRPAGRVNHGHLFTPARPLPALALPRIALDGAGGDTRTVADGRPALRGKWSLVYAGDGACDTACREALHVARETRLALGNDMSRLERVFLVTADCCAASFLAREHPDLSVLDASGPAAEPLLRLLDAPAPGPDQTRTHLLYVVDPLGNLVMSYDARTDLRGLLEDLQKLLRLSHIG
jgi:hypothetical protein